MNFIALLYLLVACIYVFTVTPITAEASSAPPPLESEISDDQRALIDETREFFGRMTGLRGAFFRKVFAVFFDRYTSRPMGEPLKAKLRGLLDRLKKRYPQFVSTE